MAESGPQYGKLFYGYAVMAMGGELASPGRGVEIRSVFCWCLQLLPAFPLFIAQCPRALS